MVVKTFIYDVRGFKSSLASKIDADYSAWHTATSPSSINEMEISISDDTLLVVIRYTA